MLKINLAACAVSRMILKATVASTVAVFLLAATCVAYLALVVSGMLATLIFVYMFGVKHNDKTVIGIVLSTIGCWVVASTKWMPFLTHGHSIATAANHVDFAVAIITTGIMISLGTFMLMVAIMAVVSGATCIADAFRESLDDCRIRIGVRS